VLKEAFYWILNMSIIATIYGLLVYFLRYIKSLPRTIIYSLWGVVLVRMLCPVSFSSKYSLMNLVSGLSERSVVKSVPVEDLSLTLSNTIQGAATYAPITYKTDGLERFFTIASAVWLLLALAFLLAMMLLYGLTMSELRKATLLRDNLYEGTMVSTPILIGIFRTRIILPVGMNSKHLEYILLHEQVHARRRDNLWRMIAIIAACIHWFNPLSWVFLRVLINDCELACDEKAVKCLQKEERKEYAHVLLTYAEVDRTIFTSAFGSPKVKVRVQQVLTYRRLTWFSAVCFSLLVGIVVFLLLTNGVT
jgi:beta-lactamase regulating signal transducer with metallopeptidase domain